MANRLVWSAKARLDLNDIRNFILKDSEHYAFKTIQDIVLRTEILIAHPKSGRVVPEIDKNDIREVMEGNYRIIYQIKPFGIRILKVYHRSRVLKKL